MTTSADTAFELVDRIRRKAPEYLDLLVAETEDEFEKAFEAILGKAVSQLEADSKRFIDLDEDGLSSVLAMALSVPGLTVTRETNSNGHVDLTIEADHCVPPRRKLGEAKIYDGPKYHISGLEQLLGRYTTGREGRGLLVAYFRDRDISGLITALRKMMDTEKPCAQQGTTINHSLKWSFVSTHRHRCGDNLQVGHIGCNLQA